MADRLRKDLQIGTFANLVAKDLQKAIRMEAADDRGICRCVTCGKKGHYKRMQGGHFVPGRRQSILFVEENIHVQCISCNNYLSGNVMEYERFMVNSGTERMQVDEMQSIETPTSWCHTPGKNWRRCGTDTSSE
jgi:hypothetical protein